MTRVQELKSFNGLSELHDYLSIIATDQTLYSEGHRGSHEKMWQMVGAFFWGQGVLSAQVFIHIESLLVWAYNYEELSLEYAWLYALQEGNVSQVVEREEHNMSISIYLRIEVFSIAS